MIKVIKEAPQTIEIDLTGPDGNVFNLIAIGGRLCKYFEYSSEVFTRRMTGGDYENAIKVFEEYFGDFVILHK
jgi:hypothetical protein